MASCFINFQTEPLRGAGAPIATLGITAPQAAAIIADCRWLIYVLGTWLPAVRAWSPACTDAAAAAQTGSGATPITLPVFTAPALPGPEGSLPAVVPVAPGALGRVFDLVQFIKNSPGRTDAIESDLRTVGPAITPAPAGPLQPVIKALVNGLHVDIKWNWGGHAAEVDLLQIQVDRGDGKGWVDLAHDTTPNYTDTAAFPVASTIWKYRGIFHVNGAPTGVWSETVSVVVGGVETRIPLLNPRARNRARGNSRGTSGACKHRPIHGRATRRKLCRGLTAHTEFRRAARGEGLIKTSQRTAEMDLIGSLRNACETDIVQAQAQVKYDYFRRQLNDEREFRLDLYKNFDAFLKRIPW